MLPTHATLECMVATINSPLQEHTFSTPFHYKLLVAHTTDVFFSYHYIRHQGACKILTESCASECLRRVWFRCRCITDAAVQQVCTLSQGVAAVTSFVRLNGVDLVTHYQCYTIHCITGLKVSFISLQVTSNSQAATLHLAEARCN